MTRKRTRKATRRYRHKAYEDDAAVDGPRTRTRCSCAKNSLYDIEVRWTQKVTPKFCKLRQKTEPIDLSYGEYNANR